jgi:hypothetical protein
MSRRYRRENPPPEYLKQVGKSRGGEEITLEDWAAALIKNIGYDAQLTTIRFLLYRLRNHDKELDDEIKRLHDYEGPHRDRAVDDWVDLVHDSVYQGAAHSMAAVGMLAPFIESVFCGGFESIREELFEDDNPPYDAHPHARWESATKNQWDCHFVYKRGRQTKDLVEGIFQLAEAVGLRPHLPADLKPMMKALFAYRNKMFHWGFEWPPEERDAFAKHIAAERWPSDWFTSATTDGKPWIFYLTDIFVDHCIDRIGQVVIGMAAYVEAQLKAERL